MVKSFSKFLTDAEESRPSTMVQFNESSISRIQRDAADPKMHIGVISAQRGDKTPAENNANHAAMAADLKKHGLNGYVQVTGHYIENKGTPQEKAVKERSFYVKHHDPKHLEGTLKKLGAKYGQESVLVKHGGDPHARLVGTKEGGYPGIGKSENVGKFHPSAGKSPFFSTLRNKKNHDYSFRENLELDRIVFTTDRTFLNRGHPDNDGPEYI